MFMRFRRWVAGGVAALVMATGLVLALPASPASAHPDGAICGGVGCYGSNMYQVYEPAGLYGSWSWCLAYHTDVYWDFDWANGWWAIYETGFHYTDGWYQANQYYWWDGFSTRVVYTCDGGRNWAIS